MIRLLEQPRQRRRPRARAAAVLLFGVLIASGIAGTSALLSDSIDMGTISITGVTVDTPTGLTATDTGTAVQVGFTPPVGGATPTSFEIFRRVGGGSYPGTPIQSVAAGPWLDTGVSTCTTYFYKVRAVHNGILGEFTDEVAVTYADSGAPSISRSIIVATSGLTSSSDIDDYVKPGGEFWAYAQVSDACSSEDSIATQMTVTNYVGTTTTAPATFGAYTTPSGQTYNQRSGPFTADAGLSDGNQPSWSITATDPAGRVRTSNGNSARVDGIPPAEARTPALVATATNYFSTALGYGEVAAAGSYEAYARYTDARSGMGLEADAVQVSAVNVTSGLTAGPLASGTFSTSNGITNWNYRSAPIIADTGLSEGLVNVTVTAYDRVGNARASNIQVLIDNTGPAVTSCTATNGNGGLRQNDTTEVGFDEPPFPGSLAPGWNGSGNYQYSVTLYDGGASNDWIDLGAFGTLELAATNWVTGNQSYPTTRMTMPSADQVRIQYRGSGGSNIAVRSATGTLTLGAVTDIAGNTTSTPTSPCSTAW